MDGEIDDNDDHWTRDVGGGPTYEIKK